jgi:hypothetical protein
MNQLQENTSTSVSVLQQEKSSITTNPFIPNEQRLLELESIETDANKIIEKEYLKNKTSSIKNKTLQEINQNIGISVIGVIDDLFKKPPETTWNIYLIEICTKEQRYAYIGVLLIMISIILYLFS